MRIPISRSSVAILILLGSQLMCEEVIAGPFGSCPTQAFLTQGKPAVLYGVNLTTGAYAELGDLATSNKLNAMGFSYHDAFLYAWYYQGKTLARIHNDYTIEPLALVTPLDANYYVGDVSVVENAYYLYRKSGTDNGLWRVALDPGDANHLDPQLIVPGSAMYLNIFDFAFHPVNGLAYSVDNKGLLQSINVTNGTSQSLGQVGQTGTFGAVYFDVDETLYISRNSDGKVFSIDVAAATPTAQFFSYGPSSSNNDGARCALAPVVAPEVPTMDFGDAPVSYGTILDDDGARHTVDGSTYMGSLVDAEARAFPAPDESDDSKDDSDDEDGVQFLTAFNRGELAVITVDAVGAGYLSVWVDFNGNGSFDGGEQVISDAQPIGTTFYNIPVPADASSGPSWLRARYSSTSGLGATGAAADGEVEDYPVQISLSATTTSYYPSAAGYVTLAYEDLWPSEGDYDLNDFVVHYRTSITTTDDGESSTLKEISISGEVVAVGAAFHSGFAISIPGLKTSDVDVNEMTLLVNNQVPTIVEGGSEQPFVSLRGTDYRQGEEALFEITRDVWNIVERGEGCSFHRTEDSCGSAANATFALTIPISGTLDSSEVAPGIFNPFIFATNQWLRNSIFVDQWGTPYAPGDGLEIHLKNQTTSWRSNDSLLGRADDVSISATAHGADPITYQNAQGLPWAIEIGGRWCHPREYQDLTIAYPDFSSFVSSAGLAAGDWFYTDKAAVHPQKGVAGYLYKEDGVLDPNCANTGNQN